MRWYIYIYIYIYIYTYIYIVCVCVCVCKQDLALNNQLGLIKNNFTNKLFAYKSYLWYICINRIWHQITYNDWYIKPNRPINNAVVSRSMQHMVCHGQKFHYLKLGDKLNTISKAFCVWRERDFLHSFFLYILLFAAPSSDYYKNLFGWYWLSFMRFTPLLTQATDIGRIFFENVRAVERPIRGTFNIYIYIYICIYCYPHTDCFVVSQLFSVTIHVGCLKLGSKPAQLYVRLSLRPLGQQAYHVWLRYLRRNSSSRSFTFYTLSATRVLNSFEELCIMRAAAENFFTGVLNPHCFVVSQLFSVWLDT